MYAEEYRTLTSKINFKLSKLFIYILTFPGLKVKLYIQALKEKEEKKKH